MSTAPTEFNLLQHLRALRGFDANVLKSDPRRVRTELGEIVSAFLADRTDDEKASPVKKAVN